MRELVPESVSADAFALFGQLLNKPSGKPLADTAEMTYWGGIARFEFPEELSSGFLTSRHTSSKVEQLERHQKTGEILVALNSDAVICMATPGSRVETGEAELGAFLVRRGDAIKMHPGTWHWLPIPVGTDEARFLVLFADRTESEDLEVVELPEPVTVKKL